MEFSSRPCSPKSARAFPFSTRTRLSPWPGLISASTCMPSSSMLTGVGGIAGSVTASVDVEVEAVAASEDCGSFFFSGLQRVHPILAIAGYIVGRSEGESATDSTATEAFRWLDTAHQRHAAGMAPRQCDPASGANRHRSRWSRWFRFCETCGGCIGGEEGASSPCPRPFPRPRCPPGVCAPPVACPVVHPGDARIPSACGGDSRATEKGWPTGSALKLGSCRGRSYCICRCTRCWLLCTSPQ